MKVLKKTEWLIGFNFFKGFLAVMMIFFPLLNLYSSMEIVETGFGASDVTLW